MTPQAKVQMYGTTPIGYEPAWRCILGTGDAYASTEPVANAGPDQTLECQGGGGADVGPRRLRVQGCRL